MLNILFILNQRCLKIQFDENQHSLDAIGWHVLALILQLNHIQALNVLLRHIMMFYLSCVHLLGTHGHPIYYYILINTYTVNPVN